MTAKVGIKASFQTYTREVLNTHLELLSVILTADFILLSSVGIDRLCGLVIRVIGYRFTGPGSIPGSTRFFCEVVGLERGPHSLVNTTEKLLERKSSSSGLENREYGRRDPSH
jgi:hypothetical protein